ncbi:hypothetical protein [Streptomyces violascens]|uniref:hypothetical protein n=1 Tax=Streptomyces violascens TaxID=67381 RepID=UPI001678B5AE|nr:hypothetical protein [Streptomyces violascens]
MAIKLSAWSTTRLIRRDLGLSGVRDMQSLVDAIAQKRGRPIVIAEEPLPAKVSGFCVRGRKVDFIVVDSNASELTRLHSTMHELFHLWDEEPEAQDTSASAETAAEAVRQLLPDLDPEAVRKVLARSHYDNPHERRAEAFATVMVQRHLKLGGPATKDNYIGSALAHRRSGV